MTTPPTIPEEPTTTSPPLVCADQYGFVWPCDAYPPVDPCDPISQTTAFHMVPCAAFNPSISEWCKTNSTHPLCNLAPPSTLPPTGSSTPIAASGLVFVLLGVLVLFAVRRARRRRNWKPGDTTFTAPEAGLYATYAIIASPDKHDRAVIRLRASEPKWLNLAAGEMINVQAMQRVTRVS